ncbi:LysR family transcriptional regulator [Thauera sinica]|uniref:LysR family transcriptional regulator n=1 Tax=Thauera sinica TaxID=2665146 RepID=A0ABW1AWU1_9RHOO|nr:LysR family transcriptional regulator [Thauera sp. K11]ATE60186.1 LysR family transcriptional regulator [Thauera sp. K11]
MQWNLDQLRQFVATAEHGSISAAARHLGKAQSAVSTAIGLLEADLGVELFDRSKHRATLSDAGQLLLLEAQELLRQAQSLQQRALSLATGGEARLALAFDEALPYAAIGHLVREIAGRFPHMELVLFNGTATEVAGYVKQERADVAFHFDRGPLRDCFDQRHIGSLPQGVFVASGHPLLDKQPVARKDLARYRQLLMHAEDVQAIAYSPKVWRSDSFYTIAEMVADDLGWAILPVNIAKYESYPKPLQQVICPSLALPPLPVRMLWCQGRQLGPTAEWIASRFAELLKHSA